MCRNMRNYHVGYILGLDSGIFNYPGWRMIILLHMIMTIIIFNAVYTTSTAVYSIFTCACTVNANTSWLVIM